MNLFAQTPDPRTRHPRRGATRRRTPRFPTPHAAHPTAHPTAHRLAPHPRLEPLESRTLFSTGLDPLFGVYGRVSIDITNLADHATAVHVLPGGKILVAGTATHGLAADLTPVTRPFVARLNPDGSLDATFGTAGIATTAPPPDGEFAPAVVYQRLTTVDSLAVGPDGRIFLGGSDAPFRPAGSPPPVTPFDPDFTVAAFSADGAPDLSFGQRGVAHFPVAAQPAGGEESVDAMVVQPDGAVVATGAVRQAGANRSDVATVRFTAAGHPDLGFGARLLPLEGDRDWTTTDAAVALQGDGKIIAMGKASQVQNHAAFTLGRYNPDGTPDGSFGVEGRVVTSVPVPQFAGADAPGGFCDVLVQADGSIVAAAKTGYFEITLARYTPAGVLDASFGGDGLVEVRATYGNAGDLRHDPADNTLTVGVAHVHRPLRVTMTPAPVAGLSRLSVLHSPGFNAYVARFDATGAVLSEKTMAGSVVTGTDNVYAVELQPDGRLLAVGDAHPTFDNGEGAAWAQTADALVVRLDPALFPWGPTAPPDTPPTPADPPAEPPDFGGNLSVVPPVFKGKPSIARGRFYKFELGFRTNVLARSTAVGVYRPTGELETTAQLLGVRMVRGKTPAENPVTAIARYRVGAPGGKFDAADNGTYAVRFGTAPAPTQGQALGQFTVNARPARQAGGRQITGTLGGELRRFANVPPRYHLDRTKGPPLALDVTAVAGGVDAFLGQRVTLVGRFQSVPTPQGGRDRIFVVTSIRAAAP